MQNRYNLLDREHERELIPLCVDQGVGIVPYSPLGRGFLAGTRTRDGKRVTTRSRADSLQDELYGRDEDFDVVDAVVEIARERDVAPAQVAVAWLLGKPAVTAPILGATRVEHVDDALAAVDLALALDETAQLEQPYRSPSLPAAEARR